MAQIIIIIMIAIIEEVLATQQYNRIPSNISYVTLYTKYEADKAKAVQLVDFREHAELTEQQFESFCSKAKTFITSKGYEDVELLSIVITKSILNARKFALLDEKCWLFDGQDGKLVIYDNQPGDFYGLKKLIEERTMPLQVIDSYSPQYVRYNEEAARDYNAKYRNNTSESSSRSFIETLTPANTVIFAINIIVFVVMSYFGSTENIDYMLHHGAMFVPAVVDGGQYYRFITCMFLHFGFMHISGNMIVLLFLGDNVERAAGWIKYLIIYFGGGLIGSIGSFLYALVYDRGIVSAGASGAIFALIGALLCIVVKNKGRLEDMTTSRLCIMIGYALYSGFTSENVDMAAHLFGLMGGFLLAMIVYRKSNE